MASDIIQLPYTATTSGDLLDASKVTVGANIVKRERMVIVDDTATANFAALVTTSGALSVQIPSPSIISGSVTANLSSNPVTGQVISLSSGTVTLSSNPTVVSASSGLIQVAGPITSASSGLIQIAGPITSASSGLVQVLQSTGAWAVTGGGSTVVSLSSAPTANISSGLITLSSAIGISSGLITLTGANVVTNASSGLVQVYQTTSPWSIAGTVTLSSNPVAGQVVSLSSGTVTQTNPSTAVTIIGSTGTASIVTSAGSNTVSLVSSGGIFVPVTSSAGLLVSATLTGGSTGVNIIGTTGGQAVVTSSGALSVTISTAAGGAGSSAVSIAAGAGVLAPVTSSGGLTVSLPTHLLTHLLSTPIISTLYQITTAPAILYSINGLSTQTVSNYMEFFTNGTTVLTGASTFLVAANPITVGGYSNIFQSVAGVACTGGITAVSRLTPGSTVGATVTVRYGIEYSI